MTIENHIVLVRKTHDGIWAASPTLWIVTFAEELNNDDSEFLESLDHRHIWQSPSLGWPRRSVAGTTSNWSTRSEAALTAVLLRFKYEPI